MMENWESNGTEEIGLVKPPPQMVASVHSLIGNDQMIHKYIFMCKWLNFYSNKPLWINSVKLLAVSEKHGVKSRMKIKLEQLRLAMLQLHLSDQ